MEKQNLSLMEVGGMMHKVFKVFKKRSEENMLAGVRMSVEQFSLLYALSLKEEEVIQKDLAEMMGKDKSAILRMIDTLEEKELVRRVTDLKDRRKNYLMITKLGNKVIDHYLGIAETLMVCLQEGLTRNEIETFHKVVKHVTFSAEKLETDKS